MRVSPPGEARLWSEMLPPPWEVFVVMAPNDAEFTTRGPSDGSVVFGCMDVAGKSYGLCILHPVYPELAAQLTAFASHNASMVPHAYRGPVSGIPQKLLVSPDFTALLFRPSEMHLGYLNTRLAMAGLMLKESQ